MIPPDQAPVFFVVAVCGAFSALNAVMIAVYRRHHRADRDEEIRAAYRRFPLQTRDWLIAKTEVLPSPVSIEGEDYED